MAGYIVGSLIMTWVLCSALNGFVEYAAIQQWLDRSKAFISMIVGVFVIAAVMVFIALWGLPASDFAKDVMTPVQLSTSSQTSIVVNVLFAVAYCAFQLRRFWDE